MELKEEIETALTNAGFANVTLDLETTDTGRIGGLVLSPSFEGAPQHKRQQMLWNALDHALSEEQRLRIIALITLTQAELEEAA